MFGAKSIDTYASRRRFESGFSLGLEVGVVEPPSGDNASSIDITDLANGFELDVAAALVVVMLGNADVAVAVAAAAGAAAATASIAAVVVVFALADAVG